MTKHNGGAPASINVYELAPPERFAGEENTLADLLFGMAAATDGARKFSISGLSGCVTFSDYGQLFRNMGTGTLPADASAVESAARAFFERANRAVASYRPNSGSERLPPLFPEILRSTGARAVYAPGSKQPDHWLVQFIAFLPAGAYPPTPPGLPAMPAPAVPTADAPEQPRVNFPPPLAGPASPISPTIAAAEPPAPVEGGIIDVRIGAGGQVIGLWSRWRPYQSVQIVPRLPPPEFLGGHHEVTPNIFYKLDGEANPQQFIAPYYRISDEHHEDAAQVGPASLYSLLVDLERRDDSQGVELTALVAGNTGPIRYAWGYWRIDFGLAAGFETLGGAPSISLSMGAYNVVLDIIDQTTGAIARTESVIYCGAGAPPQEPIA